MGQQASSSVEISYFIEVQIEGAVDSVSRTDLASYFGSKKRSGGGEITCIVYPWANQLNRALIEFDKTDCPPEIVANVLSKDHRGYIISPCKMISPFRRVDTSLTEEVYNLLRKETSFDDMETFINFLQNESYSGVELVLESKILQVRGYMHRIQALQQFIEYTLKDCWKKQMLPSPVNTPTITARPSSVSAPVPAPRPTTTVSPAVPPTSTRPVIPAKPAKRPSNKTSIAPKPAAADPTHLLLNIESPVTSHTITPPPHMTGPPVQYKTVSVQQEVQGSAPQPSGLFKKVIPVEDDAESTDSDSSSFPSLSSQPLDDDMESVSAVSNITERTTEGLESVNGKFDVDIHQHTTRSEEYQNLVNDQSPKGFLRVEDCEGDPSKIRLTFWHESEEKAGEFMDAYFDLHLKVAATLAYEHIESDGGDSLEFVLSQMSDCDYFTARLVCELENYRIKVAAPKKLIRKARSQIIRTLNEYGIAEKSTSSPTHIIDSSSQRSASPSRASVRPRPTNQVGINIPNPKTFTINNIDVTVKHGQLIKCSADVISFASQPNLSHKAGLSKLVATAGGSEQIEEIKRCLENQKQRPMKFGSIWPQKARGELAERGIKYVIHAILPAVTKDVKKPADQDEKEWKAEKEKRHRSITQFGSTLMRVLNQAQTSKCRSVAFSALSGGRPQHIVARSFVSTVNEFTRKNRGSCIEEIVYVDANAFMIRNMMGRFEKENGDQDQTGDQQNSNAPTVTQGNEKPKEPIKTKAKKKMGSDSNLQRLSGSLASSQPNLSAVSGRSNNSSPALFPNQLSQVQPPQVWQPQNVSKPVPNHMRLLGKLVVPQVSVQPLMAAQNNAITSNVSRMSVQNNQMNNNISQMRNAASYVMQNSALMGEGSPPMQTMTKTILSISLPGFENCSTMQITYYIADGIQQAGSPAPGTPYKGTTRLCYLPCTIEGNRVYQMLEIAFRRHLLFKVVAMKKGGYSIDFSDIVQKTKVTDGGKFGYPDENHLQKLEQTLRNRGIHPPPNYKLY